MFELRTDGHYPLGPFQAHHCLVFRSCRTGSALFSVKEQSSKTELSGRGLEPHFTPAGLLLRFMTERY